MHISPKTNISKTIGLWSCLHVPCSCSKWKLLFESSCLSDKQPLIIYYVRIMTKNRGIVCGLKNHSIYSSHVFWTSFGYFTIIWFFSSIPFYDRKMILLWCSCMDHGQRMEKQLQNLATGQIISIMVKYFTLDHLINFRYSCDSTSPNLKHIN